MKTACPKTFLVSMIMILTASFPAQAFAATVAGVYFPADIEMSGTRMQLQGTGVKSVAFIKAFAAALYKERGSDLNDGAKKLVVQYFVKIPGKKLNKFTLDSMHDNVPADRMAAMRPELDRMERLFVDLKPGDQFALAYVPGVGTHFIHNGQLKGIIEGEEFSRALYSVWIGQKPFDKKLKRSILGSEDEPGLIPLYAQSR